MKKILTALFIAITTIGSSLASAGVPPAVVAHIPVSGDTVVASKRTIVIMFNQSMNPATINTTTFTLFYSKGPILGQVFYNQDDFTAAFAPNDVLPNNETFVATLGAVQSSQGVAIGKDVVWRFHTGTPPNLGTSCNYAILAKSGISSVPASSVFGNIGVSPIAATAITGFDLSLDSGGQFATSSQVDGLVYAADYSPPTPANLTQAVLDMEAAYTSLANLPANFIEVGAGNISNMVLGPGVYKWSTSLLISTDVTLAGGPNSVWVFQVAQSFFMDTAASVFLEGGAQAENVFWQVTGDVTLGPNAYCEGVILCATQIVLQTGAFVNGKLLSQTAVTLDMATVIWPPLDVIIVANSGSGWHDWNPAGPVWVPENPEKWAEKQRRHQPVRPPTSVNSTIGRSPIYNNANNNQTNIFHE